MDLYEEIRGNSGISDIEYLEEGIVFFKNSTKMKRLGKNLISKHAKLIKKGDLTNAKALNILTVEVNKIAKEFEDVEKKFKAAKDKDAKDEVRKEYADLEKHFKKIVNVAKKDSTKRALIAVGGLALLVGVLAAGIFGIISMDNAGITKAAADNLGARSDILKMDRLSDAEALRKTGGKVTGVPSVDRFTAGGARVAANFLSNQVVRSTNKELVQASMIVGGTAAGVLSVPVIGQLRKLGLKNKTIADTVAAIESIQKSDKKPKEDKGSEGDDE